MGHRTVLALCSLAFAGAQPSYASQLADPAVSYVSTAGLWVADREHGRYRIVILKLGFEHLSDRVVAEWLALPADSSGVSHVAWSATLVEACMCTFDPPRLTAIPLGLQVELTGRDPSGGRVRCAFTLDQRGNIAKWKPC
jgi:hypothetical protein